MNVHQRRSLLELRLRQLQHGGELGVSERPDRQPPIFTTEMFLVAALAFSVASATGASRALDVRSSATRRENEYSSGSDFRIQ